MWRHCYSHVIFFQREDSLTKQHIPNTLDCLDRLLVSSIQLLTQDCAEMLVISFTFSERVNRAVYWETRLKDYRRSNNHVRSSVVVDGLWTRRSLTSAQSQVNWDLWNHTCFKVAHAKFRNLRKTCFSVFSIGILIRISLHRVWNIWPRFGIKLVSTCAVLHITVFYNL